MIHVSRAQTIRVAVEEQQHQREEYSPHSYPAPYTGYAGNDPYAFSTPHYPEESEETVDAPQDQESHVTHTLEYELRRKNPDLLDQIRFAMSDKQYSVFAKLLARGVFWGAAIYAAPFIVGPLIAGRAIARSRLKQIARRDAGIKPRYHLRPDDRY
jgi:hypothetical protein